MPPADVEYYVVADLKKLGLPTWNQTNNLPLTPELAIKAALAEVQSRYSNTTGWKVKHLELEWQVDDIWVYNVTLTGPPGAHEMLRVMMNGEVWRPKKGR